MKPSLSVFVRSVFSLKSRLYFDTDMALFCIMLHSYDDIVYIIMISKKNKVSCQ